MPLKGYIKQHRKVLDNPIICKDAAHFSVWNYLLLMATHKEIPALFNGKKITLQPGQLITGRKAISDKFKVSESKVQRILKTFEIEQQIEQQTSRQKRLVTVLNWRIYQSERTTKRTTNEQRLNTNKNDKKIDRIGEDILSSRSEALYIQNFGKTGIGHIRAMIEYYGETLMFDAINKSIGKADKDPPRYISQICAQKTKYKKDYFLEFEKPEE